MIIANKTSSIFNSYNFSSSVTILYNAGVIISNQTSNVFFFARNISNRIRVFYYSFIISNQTADIFVRNINNNYIGVTVNYSSIIISCQATHIFIPEQVSGCIRFINSSVIIAG